MKTNLIGIHTLNVSTDMMDFARTGIYRTVPMVLYAINDNNVTAFYNRRPVEIFREDMEYRNIKNIVENEDKDILFLTMPGTACKKMQYYANKNVNKVIADMLTHVIVQTIDKLQKEDPDAKNIFFIDNVDTNKIIGRLGYVYLENKNNTIVFVTYLASGLLTHMLNEGNEKLKFDMNYFRDENHLEDKQSEIIPNDIMESLTQTVFFNIPNREERLAPLRCDILSQGITTKEIQEKVKEVNEILQCPENITLPFQETLSNKETGIWTCVPRVLWHCIDADKTIYRKQAESILEEYEYE